MGSFRVLIAGPKHFKDYPTLRATLDTLLAKRLPDVELLTSGGPDVAMLAASYATERGSPIAAHLPEFGRSPERAAIDRGAERRNASAGIVRAEVQSQRLSRAGR
jgi:hypothetical protein